MLKKSFNAVFFKKGLSFYLFGAALLLNIILFVALAGKFGFGKDVAPLHFNIISGIDFAAAGWKVYQLPLAGLAILALNFWLARAFQPSNSFVADFLAFISLFCQIILLISASVLIILNS